MQTVMIALASLSDHCLIKDLKEKLYIYTFMTPPTIVL